MKYSIKVYILLITGLILFMIPLIILTILYLADTLPKGLGALAAVILLGISWTAALFLSADALMRMIGENFSENKKNVRGRRTIQKNNQVDSSK